MAIMTTRLGLFTILAMLALSSCSTSLTTLEVLQPSQIVLPDHIQTIATVDRSKPEKGFANFVEGLLSGETIGQDRKGRERALSGLADALSRTPRFSVKSTAQEMTGSKDGTVMMPPLSWTDIEEICRRYETDAVVAIESFDTDSDIFYDTHQTKEKNKDGTETVKLSYTARRNLRIQVGWRLYDPKTRVVRDENVTTSYKEDTGYGKSREAAANNLRDLYAETNDLAMEAGHQYGMRIAPVWVNVSRPFYTTGKGAGREPMERAYRFVQSGDWDSAPMIWRDLLAQADTKTAGRAAHNLAVAAERIGNLPGALEWAQKAFTQYGNKASQQYIYTIQQRIADQERLNDQMKAKV